MMTTDETPWLNNLIKQAKNSVPAHKNEALLGTILEATARSMGKKTITVPFFRIAVAAACLLVGLNIAGAIYLKMSASAPRAHSSYFLEPASLNLY